jgi:hypothetical protein
VTWEVGKTYWTKGRNGYYQKATIVALDLCEPFNIGGIYHGVDGKSVEAWMADGRYNKNSTGPMDLTLEETTP